MSDLKNLKKVKSIDLSEYEGTKTTIEKVELLDVEEKDFGEGKVEVRQILIETANLSDDEKKPIRVKEWVSLKKDEDGEWGIPDGKNSKATKILKFFEVENFDDLIGKQCLIVKKVSGDRTTLGISMG